MQTVTQDKLDTLTEEHHKEVCEQKETTDNTFGDKVKQRAYDIWQSTHRNDSQTNYFQALEEIRKEMCDCAEFVKTFTIVTAQPHIEEEKYEDKPAEYEKEEEDLEKINQEEKNKEEEHKEEEVHKEEELKEEVPVEEVEHKEEVKEEVTDSQSQEVVNEKIGKEESDSKQEAEALPSLSSMIA